MECISICPECVQLVNVWPCSYPGPPGGTPGAKGGERCSCGWSEGCEADHFWAGEGEEGMGTRHKISDTGGKTDQDEHI